MSARWATPAGRSTRSGRCSRFSPMDERLLGVIDTPVAVLGTIIPDGRPHLIPVTFAASGDSLVTAVAWKPKTGRKLRRIINLEADPRASLLLHHYPEARGERWCFRA